MKLTKNEKGITLVALIITIIILLILAIVSIRAIKDGGILSKTQTAKETYSESEEKEKIQLAINQAAIDGMGTINKEPLNAALTDQFKDDFQITKETEEYFKVKIKSSGRIYTINKNGNIESIEEAIKLPTGLEEGDEIELDADKDGTKEKWIVLYKNTDNIEVISKNTMGQLTLGVDDTEAQTKATDLDNSGAVEDIEKAIYSYNNAIDRLNSYCASLIKIPNEGVRSVGTVPDNPSYRDESKPYEKNPPENWTEDKTKLLQYGENKDENYNSDWTKMGNLGKDRKNIRDSANQKNYWLGSRIVNENWYTSSSYGTVFFRVRYADAGGWVSNDFLGVVFSDDAIFTKSPAYAVRPVVKLQYP